MPNVRNLTKTLEVPSVTTFLDDQGSAPTNKTAVVTTNLISGNPTGITVDLVGFNLISINGDVRKWVSQSPIDGKIWTLNTTGGYPGMAANVAT